MPDHDYCELGLMLHSMIKMAGYKSVYAFCKDTDTDHGTLSKILSGQTSPTLRTMQDLADRCGWEARPVAVAGDDEFPAIVFQPCD